MDRGPRGAIRCFCLAVMVMATLVLSGCSQVAGPPTAGTASGISPAAQQGRSDNLVRVAATALRAGDPAAAAGLYQQVLLHDGGNITAALGLGDALSALGRHLEAGEAFARTLTLDPARVEAHAGYARAMLAQHRPEAAVEHLQAVLKRYPDDAPTLNALGVAYDLMGRHDLAVGTYRQGLAFAPASATLRNNLGLSLALQGAFGPALAELRPLADGPDTTARIRQNLALVYGLKGDLAMAERVSLVDLDEVEAQNNLAFFETLRGMEDRSRSAAVLLGAAPGR